MDIITSKEAKQLAAAAPTNLAKELDSAARSIEYAAKYGGLYTTCTADKEFYESVIAALEEKGYRIEAALYHEITSAPQRILYTIYW